MKISIEQYDHKAFYECETDDLNSTEVMQIIRGLMVALTWQDSVVIDGMKELVEEYEESKNWKYDNCSNQ